MIAEPFPLATLAALLGRGAAGPLRAGRRPGQPGLPRAASGARGRPLPGAAAAHPAGPLRRARRGAARGAPPAPRRSPRERLAGGESPGLVTRRLPSTSGAAAYARGAFPYLLRAAARGHRGLRLRPGRRLRRPRRRGGRRAGTERRPTPGPRRPGRVARPRPASIRGPCAVCQELRPAAELQPGPTPRAGSSRPALACARGGSTPAWESTPRPWRATKRDCRLCAPRRARAEDRPSPRQGPGPARPGRRGGRFRRRAAGSAGIGKAAQGAGAPAGAPAQHPGKALFRPRRLAPSRPPLRRGLWVAERAGDEVLGLTLRNNLGNVLWKTGPFRTGAGALQPQPGLLRTDATTSGASSSRSTTWPS